MEKIQKYRTIDNSLFDDYVEALEHENCFLSNKNKELEKDIFKLKYSETSDKSYGGKNFPAERQRILDSLPNESGIYMWTNIHDGFKKYIGSAKYLRDRAVTFFNFGTDYGGGVELENARKEYNHPSHWEYTILCFCSIDDLKNNENFFIEQLRTRENGYNIGMAKRNVIRDNIHNNASNNIPGEIIKKYNNFLNGYSLEGNMFSSSMTMEEKRKKYPLIDFYHNLKNLNMINISGKSMLTLRLKESRYGKSTEDYFKNLSIIPSEMGRIINSAGCSYKENGIPNIISELESCNFMYSFNCKSATKYNISTIKPGFKTEEEAFKGLIIVKVNILRKIVEENRQYIDDASYEILKTLTFKEAEKLLFYRKDVFNFENNEISNEIVPSLWN